MVSKRERSRKEKGEWGGRNRAAKRKVEKERRKGRGIMGKSGKKGEGVG